MGDEVTIPEDWILLALPPVPCPECKQGEGMSYQTPYYIHIVCEVCGHVWGPIINAQSSQQVN